LEYRVSANFWPFLYQVVQPPAFQPLS
jgi:hypothetical protein